MSKNVGARFTRALGSSVMLALASASCAEIEDSEPEEDVVDADVDGDETTGEAEEALLSGDVSAWALYDGWSVIASKSFNSSGYTTDVTKTSTGVYSVRLNGIYGGAGNVQVSTYGSDRHCRVGWWGSALPAFDTTTTISVRCHAPDGSPADSGFVVSYARFPGGTAASASGAYLWMNQPTGGALDPNYQFGATSTVTYDGTGQYRVRMAGQANDNGDLQVTAYGVTGNEYCKIGGWAIDAGAVVARIHCHAPNGALADSRFSLRYYRDTRDSAGGSGGYAWVQSNGFADSGFKRNVLHNSDGYDLPVSISASRAWLGTYDVDYAWQSPASGAPLVTSYAFDVNDASYCALNWWFVPSGTTTVRSQVVCYDPSGNFTDTAFDHVYFSPVIAP
ncbi:MAG: hypothetical protein HOW73_38275 [Polyangiaceae bacterium]|nr:hypothetical protein [Polyangiaceae bacterium]